jgi:hypothetical protein
MSSSNIFDYSTPFNIMVGVWTGVCIAYSPTGEYLNSAASNVFIYWEKFREVMYFRQDELEALKLLRDKKFSTNIKSLRDSKSFLSSASKLSSGLDRLNDKAYLKNVAAVTVAEFDLYISDKYATGSSSEVDVTGTISRPDVYLFHLCSKKGAVSWYNNQYCANANERQIIGPQMDEDGKIQLVIAQTFSRISYEVPERFKRRLRHE